MTMQRMFNVVCDIKSSKDCQDMIDGSEWYASEARRVAKEKGWTRKDGKDICPPCQGKK